MAQEDFYLARAIEARAEAAGSKLDNVRERALRSAAAWDAMAERAAEIAHARETREAEKIGASLEVS
jgi:hypothetical protein